MAKPKQLRTCSQGHRFYKSSDCPICPVCEKQKEVAPGFLALLSRPARNALLAHGIHDPLQLAAYTEKEILKLHGVGKASLPIFKKALEEAGLQFKLEG